MPLPKRLDDVKPSDIGSGLFWFVEQGATVVGERFGIDGEGIIAADVLAGESGTDLEQAVAAIKVGRALNGNRK